MKGNGIMKNVSSIAMAGLTVWMAGCASAPRVTTIAPVGPAPTEAPRPAEDGSLLVYSARAAAPIDVNRDTWRSDNEFGNNEFRYEAPHSDYTICKANGEVFEHVHNARGPADNTPTLVALPPGSYKVRAEADCEGNHFAVLMPVLIRPGETTVAHLEGGWTPAAYNEAEVTKMPCGGIIGWRAPETASYHAPAPQTN